MSSPKQKEAMAVQVAARAADDILKSREALLLDHNLHIEIMTELLQSDMDLISEADKSNSNVSNYVIRLEELLAQKVELSQELLRKTRNLKEKLIR